MTGRRPLVLVSGKPAELPSGDTLAGASAKGADIASASTTDIGAATGDFVDVTGTTTVTALGTIAAGIERTVRFTGALTLTHNATSLILPGAANITTVAGDIAIFRSLGSGNWLCVNYQSITPRGGRTLLGSVTTTAGQTTVSFASVVAGHKELMIAILAGSTSTSTTSSNVIRMRFNSDTGSHYDQITNGRYSGGTINVDANNAAYLQVGWLNSTGAGAALPPNYTEVRIKQYDQSQSRHFISHETTGSQVNVGVIFQSGYGEWKPTSATAITQIDFLMDANAFMTGSVFELWAID